MNILSKLERKFGKYAIPNLMYYIVILYAAGMMLQMFAPQVYIQYLMLDASTILESDHIFDVAVLRGSFYQCPGDLLLF